MKKLVLNVIVLALASALFCHGQETQSSSDFSILPEKGDFSVGVDLVPIMQIIMGTDNVSEVFPVIAFKNMLSDKSALRSEIMLNYGSVKSEDLGKISTSSYGLAIGPEWRVGKSRVQGFFGVMGEFMYTKSKDENESGELTDELSIIGLGGKLFLGGEYFIAPKFSLGSRVTWGPSWARSTDLDGDQISVFSISAGNVQGAVMLSYYF